MRRRRQPRSGSASLLPPLDASPRGQGEPIRATTPGSTCRICAMTHAQQQPSDVLRGYFETLSRGGLEGAVALWHPEIEWRPIEGPEHVGVIRGEAEMRRYYTGWDETMADQPGDVKEIVYEDDER